MRIGWCPGGRPVADMLNLYPGTSVVRIFVGAGKPLPTWDGPILGPLVGQDIVVHLSFKTNDLPAVLAWAAGKPAGLLLLLTFAHEPEQQEYGDPTVEQFHARWGELVPAFDGHPMRGEILLGPVYTRFWWQKFAGDLRWLVRVPVDFIAWDVYNNGTTYRTPDDLLTVPRQIAARTGLPYLLAELGAVVLGDDLAGRQAWMRAMVDAARTDGALTACWFHKDEWDLATAASAAEQQTWRELTEQENSGMIVSGIQFVAGRNDYTDRDGTKYGIAIHNTSNTASATNEASYATRRTDGTSSHFYADDSQVIQSLDTKYRAGHAGSYEGNEHAVAVEITGTNDKSRAWWIANVAWDELGRVLAAVCRKYDIEPRRAAVSEMKSNPRVRAFYSHNDMRLAWGGTTHTDPGPNFPWDYLFSAVKTYLTGTEPAPIPQEDEVTQEELINAVVLGVHRALDKAATRVDSTGRQMGDDIAALLAPVHAGQRALGEAIARESSSPDEVRALLAALPQPQPVDVDALAAMLTERLKAALPADAAVTDEQLERVLRSVLGSVDNAPQAG